MKVLWLVLVPQSSSLELSYAEVRLQLVSELFLILHVIIRLVVGSKSLEYLHTLVVK